VFEQPQPAALPCQVDMGAVLRRETSASLMPVPCKHGGILLGTVTCLAEVPRLMPQCVAEGACQMRDCGAGVRSVTKGAAYLTACPALPAAYAYLNATANRATWAPAVVNSTGNIIIIGADPGQHGLTSNTPSTKTNSVSLINAGERVLLLPDGTSHTSWEAGCGGAALPSSF